VKRNRGLTLLVVLVLPLLAGGCGGSGVPRLPVYGKVALPNGEAFNGAISFLPAGDRKGMAATTRVTNGKYQFNRSDGPTAGPQTIVLRRFASGAERVRTTQPGKAGENSRSEWTLTRDVPDDGRYSCDLTLEE
jgi:hypothetical protein